MALPVALMAIGTGLQVLGAMQGARAARNRAAFEAGQIELQRENNKIQALQKSNQRNEQLRLAESSNNAFFSAMGRDIGSDMSIKAFMKRQAEIAASDVSTIESSAAIEDLQLASRKSMALYEGRATARQYQTQAFASIASGLYKYEVSKASTD